MVTVCFKGLEKRYITTGACAPHTIIRLYLHRIVSRLFTIVTTTDLQEKVSIRQALNDKRVQPQN